VDSAQVDNLVLDFLNLYFVSMYIMHYRNPLLVKSMEKVFWSFPSAFDHKSKWDRLKPEVRKQVQWLYQPLRVDDPAYTAILAEMTEAEKKLANE